MRNCRLLEKNYWRSAFMPCAFKGYTNPCFSPPRLRRLRPNLGAQERCFIKVKDLARNWTDCLWEQRALCRNGDELGSVQDCLHRFHGHHAMVFAMYPATSWKARLRRASKRKQRRDLRKAEEQQQRDGYRPSHGRGCANISTTVLMRLVAKSTSAGSARTNGPIFECQQCS